MAGVRFIHVERVSWRETRAPAPASKFSLSFDSEQLLDPKPSFIGRKYEETLYSRREGASGSSLKKRKRDRRRFPEITPATRKKVASRAIFPDYGDINATFG